MKGPVPTAVRRRSPFSSTTSFGMIDDQPPAMPARSDALGCFVWTRSVYLSGVSMPSIAER